MKFTDSTGTVWDLSLNVNVVKRVKALFGVDLSDLGSISSIGNDLSTLVDVIYGIVKPVADTQNISPDAFAERFADGETCERAAESLLEAITNFFPPQKRKILGQIREKSKQADQLATEQAAELIEKTTPQEILDLLSKPRTGSQALSE